MKTAIIVGCEGQDGRIAFDALSSKGCRVIGLGNNTVRPVLGWEKSVDITDRAAVEELMKTVRADEVYYLAAYHHSSQDRFKDDADLFEKSYAVNVLGLLNFLEGIKKYSTATRLFYASSSLIYEGTTTSLQDESTPFCPESVYGMTKLDGLLLCRLFRMSHGIFAGSGILYNHESSFRRENFISMKIIKAAVNIKQGKQDVLIVGDLNAEIDWGYAPDYVEAMQQIMSLPKPDDFVIASGEKHSVREFIQAAFDHLELDLKKYVREDPSLVTRKRKALVGNSGKLKALTGWKPKVDFRGMIKLLLEENQYANS